MGRLLRNVGGSRPSKTVATHGLVNGGDPLLCSGGDERSEVLSGRASPAWSKNSLFGDEGCFVAGGGGGGALLEGEGGGKLEAVEAGGAALRVGGGPLGQLAGHLAGAVVVQTGQNIRETPFHFRKSNTFPEKFLYLNLSVK